MKTPPPPWLKTEAKSGEACPHCGKGKLDASPTGKHEFRQMLGGVETVYGVLALPIVLNEDLKGILPAGLLEEWLRRVPKPWPITYPFAPWARKEKILTLEVEYLD